MNNFWEKNAQNWDAVISGGKFESRKITNPAILTSILETSPTSVLDIGCGEGWLSKELLARKINYLGVDGSQNLIDLAIAKYGRHFEKVSYQEIESGAWRTGTRFDVVVFNFSLLDKDIQDLLKKASSYLNPKGKIMIQTLHPSRIQGDGWNTEDFNTMGVQFDGTMPWYGRTLETWKSLFVCCGLGLERVIEPMIGEKPASIIFQLGMEG